MGAALLMSCGNSSEKMKRLAKENLELSVDYPKQQIGRASCRERVCQYV